MISWSLSKRILNVAGIALCFFLSHLSIGAAEPLLWTFQGRLIDYQGLPGTNFTVFAHAPINSINIDQKTSSDSSGFYEFKLPRGDWVIEVNPDELIARGYFCYPSFSICGSGSGSGNCQVAFPVGAIIGTNISLPSLSIIPLSPTLSSPQLGPNGVVNFNLRFDTGILPLKTIRIYHVERSDDFLSWSPISTNQLITSPIQITDTSVVQNRQRFYRAVLASTETVP